jgi:hypothetical protein
MPLAVFKGARVLIVIYIIYLKSRMRDNSFLTVLLFAHGGMIIQGTD